MRKIQKLVRYALMHGLQNDIAANRERILLLTEFKNFSDLPDSVILRNLFQLDMEDILKEIISSNFNLDDWCWKEYFDQSSLLQVKNMNRN